MPDSRPDEPPDLWALLEQAKNGCMTAYGELYKRTVDEVRGFLLGRTRSADLADDLTSQTYLNLLRKISTVTGIAGSPVAYLIRVASNLATSHARQAETRLTVPMADIGDALARATTARTPAAPVDETALVLWDGIRRLTYDQQAVLILRFQLSYSAADAAAVMGRSEAWIRQSQCRAVRALAADERIQELAALP